MKVQHYADDTAALNLFYNTLTPEIEEMLNLDAQSLGKYKEYEQFLLGDYNINMLKRKRVPKKQKTEQHKW